MFIDDTKKTATAILARNRPDPNTPDAPEAPAREEDDMGGKHMAAMDIMMAHRELSPQRLAEALGHFIDMHQAKRAMPDGS